MELVGILVFTFVGIIILLGILVLSWLISPPSFPEGEKLEPYECGNLPFGEGRSQFPLRYFFYAFIFLLFEVSVFFLFPWALFFKEFHWVGVIEGLIFFYFLIVGDEYENCIAKIRNHL